MALQNKSAIITGSASGVGLATAKLFLKEEVEKLLLLDINERLGEEQCNLLKTKYPSVNIIFKKVDVAQEIEMKEMLEYAKTYMKYIDIFVNAAGIYDSLRWKLMVEVNLVGVINGTSLGIHAMSTSNGGRGGIIINLSSLTGLIPNHLNPIYTATKFAVQGLSRSYGSEHYFKRTGVKVIAIFPSLIDTPMCVAVRNNKSPFIGQEDIDMVLEQYPPIKPEYVSQTIVDAIQDGENGSMWLAFGEKGLKYEMPAMQF